MAARCCVAAAFSTLLVVAETVVAEEGGLTLSLDNADVLELIQWASELTDKAVIVHPEVRGEVTVIAGDGLTREEAYEVFLAVLRAHGYAVVEDAQTLRVLPAGQARREGLPLTESGDRLQGPDLAFHVFRLRNVSAEAAVGLLQPLVSPAGHLAAHAGTNLLLIADRGDNIGVLLELVDRMDQVGLTQIELIELRHASAEEVAELVRGVLPESEHLHLPLRMSVDSRSNRLLLSGDPLTRDQVRRLVAELDRAPEGAVSTRLFRLQYVAAEEAASILRTVADGLVESEAGREETELTIALLANANALLVSGPPSLAAQLGDVLVDVDVPQAQVLVEAIIVEVSQDSTLKLGVEWLSDGVSGDSGVVGGFSFYPGGVTPLSLGEGGAFTVDSGVSVGRVSGGDLRTLLNVLASDADTNILSTPKVLTMDNEEASILVGSNVPFITGSESQDNGNPFTTVRREDIGIELRVRPRVNNDDWVTLTIEQSVESIATSAVAATDIITNKREIGTRVMVRSGATLALGGLMRDEATEARRKVPLLGDIPLLGAVFRSTDANVVKSNLMVFIRPLILRDGPGLEAMTRSEYDGLRDQQRRFGRSREPYWLLGADPPVLPPLPVAPAGEQPP